MSRRNSPVTYILECSDGTLYTGWTTDLKKRLRRHNTALGAKYTRSRLPVILVYSEDQLDRSAAMKREAAIKKLTRAQKLELIRRKHDDPNTDRKDVRPGRLEDQGSHKGEQLDG